MGRGMAWQNEQPTQVEMTWGLESVEPGGEPISLLRWEGREISNPCLIIANVAYMRGRVPNEARTANRCLRRSSTMPGSSGTCANRCGLAADRDACLPIREGKG